MSICEVRNIRGCCRSHVVAKFAIGESAYGMTCFASKAEQVMPKAESPPFFGRADLSTSGRLGHYPVYPLNG
jgi:hypothetical protein